MLEHRAAGSCDDAPPIVLATGRLVGEGFDGQYGDAPYNMGIVTSAFVVMSAYARAQELLSGRQQTLLNQGDHQALLAALDEETTPTSALLEVWQLHQDQVVRD